MGEFHSLGRWFTQFILVMQSSDEGLLLKGLYGKRYTIALLKPDAIQSGTVPKLVRELKEDGFNIVYQEERFLSEEEAHELYRQQRSETYFVNLVNYMTSGPSIALILTKAHDSIGNIINDWREKVGPTNVADAAMNAPQSLRARYGREGFHNAFHASHNEAAAQKEMAIIFPSIAEELALQKTNMAREKILEYAVVVIRPATFQRHKKDEILVEFEHEKMAIVTFRRMQISCEHADVMHKLQGFMETMKHVTATTCGMAYSVVVAGTNIYSGKLQTLLGPEDLGLAKATCPCSLRAKFTPDGEEVSCMYATQSIVEAKLVISLLFPHLTHELHLLEMQNNNDKLLEKAQKDFQKVLPQYAVLLIVPHNISKFEKEEMERLILEARLEIFCWKVMTVSENVAKKFTKSYSFHERYATILERITSKGPCVIVCVRADDVIHRLASFLTDVQLPEAKEKIPETVIREDSDMSVDINTIEELVEVSIGVPSMYGTKSVLDMKSDLKMFFPEHVDFIFKNSFDCLNTYAVCIISNTVVQHYSKGYILSAFHKDHLTVLVERDTEMTDTDVEQFYPRKIQESTFLKTKECVVGTAWIVAIYTTDAVKQLESSLEYGHLSDLKMEHDIIHIRPSIDNLMAESEMKVFFPTETTMALIKPDAIDRATEILELIGRTGLKVVAQTTMVLNEEQVKRIYRNKEKEFYYMDMVSFLTSGTSILLALKGYGAVSVWRRLIGPADPIEARQVAPDSIRALFGTSLLENAVHGASNMKTSQDCLSKLLDGKEYLYVPLMPVVAPKPKTEAVYMVHSVIPEMPPEERFASFLRKYNLQIEDLMADMLRGPEGYEFPIVKSLREPRIRKKVDAKSLKTSLSSCAPLVTKQSKLDNKTSKTTSSEQISRSATSSASLPRVKSFPVIHSTQQPPKVSKSSASLPGQTRTMTKYLSGEDTLPHHMSTLSSAPSNKRYVVGHDLADLALLNPKTKCAKRRVKEGATSHRSPARKTSRESEGRMWTSPDNRPASQPKLASVSRGRKKLTSSSGGGGGTRRTRTMTNVAPFSTQRMEDLVRSKTAGQRGDSKTKTSKKPATRSRPTAAMRKLEIIANMEKIQASSEKIRTHANYLQRSTSISKMLAETRAFGRIDERYSYVNDYEVHNDSLAEVQEVEDAVGHGELTRASPHQSVDGSFRIEELDNEEEVQHNEDIVIERAVILHEESGDDTRKGEEDEGNKENEDPSRDVAGGDAVECVGCTGDSPRDEVEEKLRNAMLDFQSAMNLDMTEGKTFLERLKFEFLTAANKQAWPAEKRVDTPFVSRQSSQIYGSETVPASPTSIPNTAKEIFCDEVSEKFDHGEINEIQDDIVCDSEVPTLRPVESLSVLHEREPRQQVTSLAKLLVESRFKFPPNDEETTPSIPDALKPVEVRLPEVPPDELPAMEDSFCTSVVSIVFFDIISEVIENIQIVLAKDAITRIDEVSAHLQEAAVEFKLAV